MGSSEPGSAAPHITEPIVPLSSQDAEDSQRVVRMLTTFSWIGMALSLVFSLGWLLVMPQRLDRLAFPLLTFTSASIPLILVRLGRVRLGSLVLLGGVWIAVTLSALSSGGTRAPSFALYTPVIMGAALLLGWRAAVGFFFAVVVASLAMVLPAAQSILPPQQATPAGAWLIHMVTAFLTLANVFILVDRSQKALRRAQQELARREKAEKFERESEGRFRKIFELSQAGIAIVKPDGTLVSVNPAALDQMGTPALQDILGHPFLELGVVGDRQAVDALEAQIAQIAESGGALRDLEFVFHWANGTPITVLFSASTIELDGEPHVLISSVDISGRKAAEAELRREKDLNDAIINTMPGIFALYDLSEGPNGKMVRWNRNHEVQMAYSGQELAQIHLFDLVPSDQQPDVASAVGSTSALAPSIGETELLLKDGTRVPYLLSGSAMSIDGRPYLVGVGLEIAERKRMEAALRASEERYRIISRTISDFAFSFSVSIDGGRELTWMTDEPYLRVTGYDWHELRIHCMTSFTLLMSRPSSSKCLLPYVASPAGVSVESTQRKARHVGSLFSSNQFGMTRRTALTA